MLSYKYMVNVDLEYGNLLAKNAETVDKVGEIGQAVSFLCQKLKIMDTNCLGCKVKVTDTFVEDYKHIHFKPESIEANGITVPPMFQSLKYRQSVAGNSNFEGKTIILINNERLKKVHTKFYISVIIHELSHCTDFVLKLSKFQEIYGIELNDVKTNTVANAIGGYFCAYSEVWAKYWQEMYIVETHDPVDYSDIFFKQKRKLNGKLYISSEFNFDSMEDNNDEYHAQHIAGKIRCWEDAFINHPLFPCCFYEAEQVERIKNTYLRKDDNYNLVSDMYEIWDWDVMNMKCDKILDDFKGNLDAVINYDSEK